MALPDNVLQQVQTYQDGHLALLQNGYCLIDTSNTLFKDFDKLEGNLGSTVTFDQPPRFSTTNTLVASFQPSVQLVETLTVNQALTTSYAFSTQQFIFNVRDYMKKFGNSAVAEIGAVVEKNVAFNFSSGVVDNNPESNTYGQKDYTSGPYRFFGNGTDPINSVGQLAQMLANFRNFGAAKGNIKVYLPDTIVPQIVNSSLGQFVMNRNEKEAMSWEVNNWNGADFYQSNLLPIQNAGNVGNSNTTLTLVSVNDPTGQNVTQLTFSGASANDLNAIKAGDLAYFLDGVSGQPNIRYLTWIGNAVSRQQVQFRSNFDAVADGSGNITVSITPAITWQANNTKANAISNPLAPGMQVKFLPDHAVGAAIAGDALFLAMPSLPDQPPYPTSNKSDPDSGVSIRLTYGTLFGQNQQGFINDCIWGSTLIPNYCMRLVFPINQ
jgi:hypothetical protein